MPRIDFDHNRIRHTHDLHDLAFLLFPQKSATQLRAAGIAIILEIKNHRHQKLHATDFIAIEYDLSPPAVCKARKRLRKLGLIDYRAGNWILSTRFEKALNNLAKIVRELKTPALTRAQKSKEQFQIDLARNLKQRNPKKHH